MRLPEFFPWTAAIGWEMSFSRGMFSGIVPTGTMFHMTQWVYVPEGASGSSRIIARHIPFPPVISTLGDVLAPSQVNCDGNLANSNLTLSSSMFTPVIFH